MKKIITIVILIVTLIVGFGTFKHFENQFLGWCRWLQYCEGLPDDNKKSLPSMPPLIEYKKEIDVVGSVLASAQKMNQITVFAARLVAITSIVDRTCIISKDLCPRSLDKKNTLISPGSVRYDVQFKNLTSKNFYWDKKNNKLWISIEDPKVSDINIDELQTITIKGGISVPWIGNDEENHEINMKAARIEIKKQANSILLMNLARESGRAAIANNFLLPLRIVGIDADVAVRFPSDFKKVKG